jgi:hypothetical protein
MAEQQQNNRTDGLWTFWRKKIKLENQQELYEKQKEFFFAKS